MLRNITRGRSRPGGRRRKLFGLVCVPLLAASAIAVWAGASNNGSGSGNNSVNAHIASAAHASSNLINVTVATPGPYTTMVPLYVALDKGLFAKQGLNVKVVPFDGDSAVVKATVGGSVNIAVASLAGVLQGIQAGAPLKVIYGGFDQSVFRWYGKSLNWKSAQGTKWGVSSIGSSTDFMTRYLLEQHGVNPDTQATIVQTGGGAGQLNALKTGQIDYAITLPSSGLQLEAEGFKQVAAQSSFMSQYPQHVVYATSSYIQSNASTIQKFLKGLSQGMAMAKSNSAAGVQAIVKNLKLPAAPIKKTYSTNVQNVFPNGQLPNAQSMATFWKIGIQNKQFKAKIPESKWLDTQWIKSYKTWSKSAS